MNNYRELFEKYSSGKLEDSKVEELHHHLVELYFLSPEVFNRPEFEYTEDLVIEMYSTGELEEKYAQRFRKAIENNKILSRKYHLLKDLGEAREKVKNTQIIQLNAENPELDQKEEEQLSKILQEVIEKVHAEQDASLVKNKFVILLKSTKAIFKQLIPSVIFDYPHLKTALVFASIILIAGIIWISIKPESEKMVTEKISSDSGNNKGIVADTGKGNVIKTPQEIPPVIQKPEYARADSIKNLHTPKLQYAHKVKEIDTLENQTSELDQALLAYADDIPAGMEYMEMRSLSSWIDELYIQAAKSYENKQYDSCISIFGKLLRGNYIKSPDTLNTIRFYMGISYIAKGFQKPDRQILKLARKSFGNVDKNSLFFNDSRWYSALVMIRLGNKAQGIRILDSLVQTNYLRSGEVKLLRDKLTEKSAK